jgi:uncharacterized protein YcbX
VADPIGKVAELWRYPVKSMAGERLATAPLTEAGVLGDRAYALLDLARRKALTARQVDALLGWRASAAGDTSVSAPDGRSWSVRDPALGRELAAVAGRAVELREAPGENFDDSPVLLVNLATVDRLQSTIGAPVDHRRFRANLYLSGLPAGVERGWAGQLLRAGAVTLELVKPCERCVVITMDPETRERWPELLNVVVADEGGMLGVYCRVVEPGMVSEGDEVLLVRAGSFFG